METHRCLAQFFIFETFSFMPSCNSRPTFSTKNLSQLLKLISNEQCTYNFVLFNWEQWNLEFVYFSFHINIQIQNFWIQKNLELDTVDENTAFDF